MTTLVVVLHILVCLFLIAVILLQAGRGQGLSWGVFGSTPQSILGTKTASFLSRLTTACAVIFLFTCIALNIIETRKSASLIAPAKILSRLDFSKIKEALDQAAKTTETEGTAPDGQPAADTQSLSKEPAPTAAPANAEPAEEEQQATQSAVPPTSPTTTS